MMLCPNCLREVSSFPMTKHDTGRAYRCTECNEAVPVMYAEDYAKFGPVIFSVMGYSIRTAKYRYTAWFFYSWTLALPILDVDPFEEEV